MKIRHKVELAFVIVAFIMAYYNLLIPKRESSTILLVFIAYIIFDTDMALSTTDKNGDPFDKKLAKNLKTLRIILFSVYIIIFIFRKFLYL